ncbi:hypothetical protein DKX38_030111 (mitochondrion) [Salix brachista]|uniref:Cytochrome c oxidase subunit 2 n=1 Tax=Salix brachista TaxID=2182728 RepID=A0A5N5IY16_9ROSI|nr:hypothetical protein DKX38_030111 [Salix brachista]
MDLDLISNGTGSSYFVYILDTYGHIVAEPWQLGFQDAASPMMQGIMDLHHDIFFFLILILVFVLWILVGALWHFHYKKNPIPQRIVHGTTIEILWTIFPSLILMFIAIPSFALLYAMDEVVVDPAITMKAIGHQWYWTYEYSDYNSSDEESLTFDSYMIPEDDLELGQLRLLEVDNRLVVPANSHLRLLVTSADVLHSWAVPSLGVKCDAVPGRLNQISILVQREGVYYGQCKGMGLSADSVASSSSTDSTADSVASSSEIDHVVRELVAYCEAPPKDPAPDSLRSEKKNSVSKVHKERRLAGNGFPIGVNECKGELFSPRYSIYAIIPGTLLRMAHLKSFLYCKRLREQFLFSVSIEAIASRDRAEHTRIPASRTYQAIEEDSKQDGSMSSLLIGSESCLPILLDQLACPISLTGLKDSFHSIKEISFEAYTYKEDDRRQNSEDYWVSKKAVVHHPKENGSLRQHEVPISIPSSLCHPMHILKQEIREHVPGTRSKRMLCIPSRRRWQELLATNHHKYAIITLHLPVDFLTPENVAPPLSPDDTGTLTDGTRYGCLVWSWLRKATKALVHLRRGADCHLGLCAVVPLQREPLETRVSITLPLRCPVVDPSGVVKWRLAERVQVKRGKQEFRFICVPVDLTWYGTGITHDLRLCLIIIVWACSPISHSDRYLFEESLSSDRD